ncbi:MAG: hypothetical protein HYV63_06245 [Candidatus Schekmanbacteria bacterium]|nr:hypothetical protein [Candidatus Schekmanbacteria bacterium]
MTAVLRSSLFRGVGALSAVAHGKRFHGALALAVVVLALPAFGVGFRVDDYLHQSILLGKEPISGRRPPLSSFFSFLDGDSRRSEALRSAGIVPWWMPLDLRANLWRPVSALTHVADHAVAPGSAVWAHAHSLLWAVALALLASICYRRVFGTGEACGAPGVAVVAAVIYALDEAKGWPIGWVANRNALISGAFGIMVLLAHDRWRRSAWKVGAVLAPALLFIGLLAGEATIGITAYLFAHAMFLDSGSLARRLACLVPYSIVVAGWRILYGALGYGTSGSGLYVDPAVEPLRYSLRLFERIPALLADQLISFPSILVGFLPGTAAIPVAVGLTVALALVGRAFFRSLRNSVTARFWACGMMIATLPIAATMPAPRLLTFVSLGGSALVAEVIVVSAAAFLRSRMMISGVLSPRTRLGGRFAMALVALHLLFAPMALPVQVYAIRPLGELMVESCAASVPADGSIREKTVVFLNSSDLCVGYVHFIRAVTAQPMPRSTILVASALYDLEVTAVDEQTLEIEVAAGMQSSPADTLLRGADNPLPIGERIAVYGASFEITSWNENRLVDRYRVRFDLPLRDPRMLFVASRGGTDSVMVPPAPGETVRLPKVLGL